MIGTWRWNAVLGLAGCIMTVWLSWAVNVWTDTLFKGLWSFVWLFVLGYALRWVLGTLVGLKHAGGAAGDKPDERGGYIDYVTPDDDGQLSVTAAETPEAKQAGDGQEAVFEPMAFPKLQSKRPEPDTGDTVRAVRHFSQMDND